MPQRLPDRRAPERMADMPDEWGLLSELGPMSRTDLFSVGDWESAVPSDVEFLVRTGQAVPPVAARRPVRHATRLVGLPPPPMPETAPPPGSLLTQAAHDLELVEARVRRLEREVMDADQTEQAAGDSDSFLTHLRPTGRIVEEQAQREADLSRRSGAREQTTSARGTEILQQISAGGSQTPQPNGASRRAVVTVVPQPSAPSAETPVAAPALGTRTTVPRVERNDAVRDWRNGVAQQPQLPPSTPWDAQPTAASSSQARRQAPSTRPHGGPHVHNWSRWRSEVGQHDTARSAVDPRILYQFDHRWTPISPAAAAGTSGHPREAGPTPIATFARSPVNDASLDYGPNPFEHPATRPEPGTSSIRTRNLAWRRGMRELGREREPDMAGAPPPATSGLRPFLLGTHPPFRASPNWDESGRPSNRLANAAGRHVPSTASSAHATAGDPPAVPRSDGSRPHSVVPQYPDPSITDIDFELAHNPFSTPGFDTVNSYVHSPYITGSPLQSLFRPSERSPAPVSAFANTGRADGGDPVDLSGRTLRRSGTQPGLVPPPTGALGSAAQPQSLTPASFPARPRYGSSLSMFVHEDLYMRMANANTDPEERAVRLLAVALLTIDPQGFINGKVSTPDDFRLRSEMAPQSRTQLFTRAARAVAIFPMLNRRQFMTNVLIRSRWMDARVEGDKDECCPICQDDYEPSQVVWVTPCNHMYHGSCLERWIKTPNVSSCPMCRRDLALLHATSLLCREGTEVARKIWMQMPTDLVPPREH
ncbi:hypothetical protein CspeluHIS016_0307780 [Cutaneotrichosporon spelunceum]|uniref:RING-type domain-containing protein n=1 Tax=Cutaneotrichosporon spelunceum TaxID=1672016 RepID=A0AAD3TU81_9TREE|nr:hypothetical protein CspeluHIS016_0307780 [Cutaneotrichosporon spelunceum]